MADNTYKNLDAWVGQNSAIDTTLNGKPAKKIIEDGNHQTLIQNKSKYEELYTIQAERYAREGIPQ